MKNKITVVLEGLPGGGKTTLAQRLAEELKGVYIPEIISTDKYRPDQDEYYIESELEKVKIAAVVHKKFCFFDRSHVSMLAYNYGKKVNNRENIYDLLIDRFKAMPEPDLYVYLKITDISLCNQRKGIEGRNPVWINIKNLEKIKEYYDNFFSNKTNKLIIPVDELDISGAYKLVINHLKINYGK